MNKTIFTIGGSPCSGKSTVAERLAKEYGVCCFHADDFLEEFISLAAEKGLPICSRLRRMTAEEIWMRSPAEQCREEFAIYEELADFIFRKLHAAEGECIIAEGAAFTPDIMKKRGTGGYLCLVPSPEFQISRYRLRERIWQVLKDCPDKEAAFDNWMQRDILFAEQVRRSCEAGGIPCMVNDGEKPVDELADTAKIILGMG